MCNCCNVKSSTHFQLKKCESLSGDHTHSHACSLPFSHSSTPAFARDGPRRQEAKSTYLAKWTPAEFAAPQPGDTNRIREFIKCAFVERRWFRAKKERKPVAAGDEDDAEEQQAPPPPPPMSTAAMRAAAHKRRDSNSFPAAAAAAANFGDSNGDFSFSPPPAARPSAAAASGFGDDDPFALPPSAPSQPQAAAQPCTSPAQYTPFCSQHRAQLNRVP